MSSWINRSASFQGDSVNASPWPGDASEPQVCSGGRTSSALDPVLAEDVLSLLLAQPGCLVSLHRPDLIHRFDRVLGLRHGAVVFDEPANRLSEQTIQWLYSSP